jgi:uncharacterized protein (DUF1501 family)
MLTRRRFLTASSLVAWGPVAPAFLARTARAAARDRERILVMVQLTGGNDGLNTVIPRNDPLYASLRPTIKIPRNEIRAIDDRFGFHPALEGFAKLLEKQALCVVHGVGYPNPSQSHFRSMDIWQAGSTDDTLTEGWIGKSLKRVSGPAFHLAAGNEVAPLALAGAPVRAPSISSLADYQMKYAAGPAAETKAQRAIIEDAARPASPSAGLLDFVNKTSVSAFESSRRLKEIGADYQPAVPYPQTGLANRLKLAAQLIDADIGARVFYVSIDGFDTHSGQGGATGVHANLLREVGDAIAAFYGDVSARGHGDRVLIATFSEFGRRARENGSRGTDHGSGAPMFLVGGKVRPGLVGEHPSLEKLDDGNLKHTTDFRRVYATLCDRWLGAPSADVLGASFPHADVLRT